MIIFFGAGFLVCAVYWIAMTLYAGQLLVQHEIWILLGAGFLFNAFAAWGWQHSLRFFSLPVVTAIHTVFFAILAVILAAGIFTASGLHPKAEGSLDYIIVLGAPVKKNGELSQTLRKRLRRAAQAAQENPGAKIVLSGGGNEPGRPSEAEYMAEALTAEGVSPDRFYLEIQSKNTYENIAYSFALIDRMRKEEGRAGNPAHVRPTESPVLSAETRPLRIGIVSSDFHMFRALHLARNQSDQQIFGIAAASDPVLFPHNMVRESMALVKDKFLGRL